MRWITLLAIASASLSLLWSSPSRANDASIMRVARVQIDAKQYRKALSTLKLMSFCAVRCQYAKAIVHSKLRDRNETRLLTQQLVNDRATPAIIRSASAKLLNWAIDKRITETTGRRTVRRETLGGVTYSDDVCTNDTFLMKVWQQQWKEIGINPDDIFVPPALKPCNLGPPIIKQETYSDRCESSFRDEIGSAARKEDTDELGDQQFEDGLIEQYYSDLGFGGGIARRTELILESKSVVLDCATFSPPEIKLEG